jgi:outer membrane lipoprotein-sorting protein
MNGCPLSGKEYWESRTVFDIQSKFDKIGNIPYILYLNQGTVNDRQHHDMRNRSVLLAIFLFAFAVVPGRAATPAQDLFAKMERHLRDLNSLQVTYQAEGAAFPEGGERGTMVWVRPDGFYHDTPEWTLAQRGRERWRYLKDQQTLILEDVRPDEPLLPEQVLFELRQDVEPETVETDSGEAGALKLTLSETGENEPGHVWLWMRPESVTPFKLSWPLADGTIVIYRVESWQENAPANDALFDAPHTENVIDFREGKARESK